MADFDTKAAKAAGYSDDEIARMQRGITAAKAAGYSDEEIRQHLSGATGVTSPSPTPTSVPPIPATPAEPSSWTPGRVLRDLGHYPALAAQAAATGATGLINFPGTAADFINRYTAPSLPQILTTPMKDIPGYLRGEKVPTDLGEFPSVATPDLGEVARPQGPAESYGAAGIAGATAGLLGGGVTRLPALLQASGREIAAELPSFFKGAVTAGAIPAVATEAAERNLDLSGLGPQGQTAAEMLIGATAAAASHHLLKGSPVDAVAGKLGVSENSDHAGGVAQAATQQWRKDLPGKIEALKDIRDVPLTPEGDVTGPAMFGKVPLDSATADMTETTKVIGGLAKKGGIFAPLLHEFGNDMPVRAKGLLDAIAQRNEPIVEYPPQAEVPPEGTVAKGPVGEDPAQVTRPGPMPPYGTNAPAHPDAFPGSLTVAGGGRGEVEFHLPTDDPIAFETPTGTTVGFKAPLRDVMELRSYIGEMTAKGLMPKGTTDAQWDALYRGLSADLGNTMERYGARDAWDHYNTSTTRLYTDGAKLGRFSNDDNPGKDTAKPGEEVAKVWNSMQKDSHDIATIRAHMPAAADEIAAAYLRTKPQGWNKLPEGSQRALVPNPFDRLTLSLNAAPKPDLATETARNREPLFGGSAGYVLGDLLKPHGGAEGSTALMSPEAWTALGIMTPAILRFLEHAKDNPRMFKVPALGAVTGVAGANAAGTGASPLVAPPNIR